MAMIIDTKKSNFGSQEWVWFQIWFTIMTLCNKMRQIVLQNATAISLQNTTKVYYKIRHVFYYKMRQFYYKMQCL